MKKIMILAAIAFFSNAYAANTVIINNDLLEIKAYMPGAEKVGVIFNPESVSLTGGAASVKAVALPVSNGPALVKQSRVMLRNVDAIYLMQGRFVTAEKLAKMLVKNAKKSGVRIFTNDPALGHIEGISLIGAAKTVAANTASP